MILHWPELAEPYATALEEAVAWILAEYTPTGIVACGSVLRGEGVASSDLDIQVIHTQPWRQRVQQWFNGVPAEIFVNPPEQIRRYFTEERGEGSPSTAHMLATGFTVLASDDIVETLRAEARETLALPPNASETMLMIHRYEAATMLEDALDVETVTPADAVCLLEYAMRLMIHYTFLAANRHLPREKKMVSALAILDPTLGELAQQFYTELSAERRFQVAKAFAERTLGGTGFFAWTGERQAVQE